MHDSIDISNIIPNYYYIVEISNIKSTMETNLNIDFAALTSDDIITLINNTLSGDNAKISEATKLLKAYTKHKSSISIILSYYP